MKSSTILCTFCIFYYFLPISAVKRDKTPEKCRRWFSNNADSWKAFMCPQGRESPICPCTCDDECRRKTERLQDCCQKVGVKPECQHLCRYDADTFELTCSAKNCYNDLQRWMKCAADTPNPAPNVACCKAMDKPIQPVCQPFCEGNIPRSDTLLGLEYYACLARANEILQCHFDNLPPEPNYLASNYRFEDVQLDKEKLEPLEMVAADCKNYSK